MATSTKTALNMKTANYVRSKMSAAAQERIPVATKGNSQEVVNAILSNGKLTEEWMGTFAEMIIPSISDNAVGNNPLLPLYKGVIPMGAAQEEFFVDLITPENYSSSDDTDTVSDLFKRHPNTVYTYLHVLNDQKTFKLTIEEEMLRRNFLDYGFMEDIKNKMIGTIKESAEQYIFEAMKAQMLEKAEAGEIKPVVVKSPKDEATAKEFVKILKSTAGKMKFTGDKFNYWGANTRTPYEDLYILMTPDTKALLETYVDAYAFNLDKVDLMGHVIEVDDFGGLEEMGVHCVMVDKKWYVDFRNMTDKLNSQYVPNKLRMNFFLIMFMTFSTSPVHNAVMFTDKTPTYSGVTITGAPTVTARKGDVYQVVAKVQGTNLPFNRCIYTLSGNQSKNTRVLSNGLVEIALDEKASSLTVKVDAYESPEQTASLTINLI